MSLLRLENNGTVSSANHGGGHGHGMVQAVSHQFEDIDQQNESYIVGMWTFLVTEIMFFGALFLAYSVYRVLYYQAYLDAHRFLSIPWGTVNTFVLLSSSLAMALAVHAHQQNNKKALIGLLSFVVLCSFAFLGVKTIEYGSKFREGLFPGPHFDYALANEEYAKEHPGSVHEGADGTTVVEGQNGEPAVTFQAKPAVGFNTQIASLEGTGIAQATESSAALAARARSNKAQLFFCLYFVMTGLHAVHIIVGILMMVFLAVMAAKNSPVVDDYMPTELVGLYWHFVDIVWIFLFPMMYLIS